MPARSAEASRMAPQAFAGREIERDNLVLGDAVEVPIGTKAQSARLAERDRAGWRERADEVSVRGVVFANGRNGIWRAERALGNDNVAVGCDRDGQGS
jgi:hypothetical protein